jgi:hypothetical protein
MTPETWEAIVEIDTDIVQACRELELVGKDRRAHACLCHMLDMLIERKQALLAGQPATS